VGGERGADAVWAPGERALYTGQGWNRSLRATATVLSTPLPSRAFIRLDAAQERRGRAALGLPGRVLLAGGWEPRRPTAAVRETRLCTQRVCTKMG